MMHKQPCNQNKIMFATLTTKYCFARLWYLAPLSHQNSAEPDTGGQEWQAALWSLQKWCEFALTVGSSEKSSLLFKMLHSAKRVCNHFLSSLAPPPFQADMSWVLRSKHHFLTYFRRACFDVPLYALLREIKAKHYCYFTKEGTNIFISEDKESWH